MDPSEEPSCLYCQRVNQQVPLLPFSYQGQDFWICAQHLPILIHQPANLAGKLPGAEGLAPAKDHDH